MLMKAKRKLNPWITEGNRHLLRHKQGHVKMRLHFLDKKKCQSSRVLSDVQEEGRIIFMEHILWNTVSMVYAFT